MKPEESAKCTEEQIRKIGDFLRDPSKPLKARFRALFTLRNINGAVAIEEIGKCFETDDSALLKHELAYCLGQMQLEGGVPILEGVLETLEEHPMVRHEAAEALGAIGTEKCLEILKKYEKDGEVVVRETVELALRRILEAEKETKSKISAYQSVDPAFPLDCTDVKKLEEILMNEELPLYQRYQAMFSLRDLNTNDSILALCKGFQGNSALFRHEIAFVLGQIQSPESIAALTHNLKDLRENEMVRHECAEALGAIGTPECEQILKAYLDDDKRVVRESCVVALDICDYENTADFQYADGLQTIK